MKAKLTVNGFFLAVSIAIILLFFTLNVFTPLTGDDFSYSNGITSIANILAAVKSYYLGWGGRITGAFLTHFCLLLGKGFFNIANTFVYTAFIILIVFHITGSIKKITPFFFFIISIFIWFFVKSWGNTFLWLTGTTQYLWTLVLILIFLLPYRIKPDTMNIPLLFCFFLFSVIAGCTNENSGAGILVFLAAYFFIKHREKEKIKLYEILGAVGFFAGFALLIAAPGNFVRLAATMADDDPALQKPLGYFIESFIDVNWMFLSQNGLFLFIVTCASVYIKRVKLQTKISSHIYLFALTGLAMNYSMIVAPGYPDRAHFAATIFLGIALFSIIKEFDVTVPPLIKNNALLFSFLGVMAVLGPFMHSARNLMQINKRWKARIEYILAEKAKGNLDIIVKAPIPAIEPHAGYAGKSPDILSDPNEWPNNDMAAYYGVNSIRGEYNTKKW
jgi:hypothetical protein